MILNNSNVKKVTFLFVKRMSLMSNKLTIAILKYRTLIKMNWTKQKQIKETPKFGMNQFQIIIFYG